LETPEIRAMEIGACLGRRALVTAARVKLLRQADRLAALAPAGWDKSIFASRPLHERAAAELAAHVAFLAWRCLIDVCGDHVCWNRNLRRQRFRNRVLQIIAPMWRNLSGSFLCATFAVWRFCASSAARLRQTAQRRRSLQAFGVECARETLMELAFLCWSGSACRELQRRSALRLASLLSDALVDIMPNMQHVFCAWRLMSLVNIRCGLRVNLDMVTPLLLQSSSTIEQLRMRLLSVRIFGACRRQIFLGWRRITVGHLGKRPSVLSRISSRASSPDRRPATECKSPSPPRNSLQRQPTSSSPWAAAQVNAEVGSHSLPNECVVGVEVDCAAVRRSPSGLGHPQQFTDRVSSGPAMNSRDDGIDRAGLPHPTTTGTQFSIECQAVEAADLPAPPEALRAERDRTAAVVSPDLRSLRSHHHHHHLARAPGTVAKLPFARSLVASAIIERSALHEFESTMCYSGGSVSRPAATSLAGQTTPRGWADMAIAVPPHTSSLPCAAVLEGPPTFRPRT